jgi:C4-dicarboxylate-specific signal transduction histidine kinase
MDLNAVIESCLQLLQDRISRLGVTLTRELDGPLPPVQGDPMELEQVLVHLIINALDALRRVPEGQRRLCLASRHLDGRGLVQVAVRDSGPGVAPEVAGQLFEPWVSDKQENVGIGLSIARGIVAAHNGRIWWEREGGEETVFIVELPVGQGSAP